MYYKGYELVDGKKIAYIRVNEWKDNVVLFFSWIYRFKRVFPFGYSRCLYYFF